MSDRDELASQIQDVITPLTRGEPDFYPEAFREAASAILARWRLVPVEPVVTFVNHPAGTPCPDHDTDAGHYDDTCANALTCAATHGWANCPPNEAGDVRCHNDGERVNVRCWKCGTPRPKPRTDQHGPHED
jgi:hypothetical protein